MMSHKTDRTLLFKGLKLMIFAVVTLFMAPIILSIAFNNKEKPLYIPILIIGCLIGLLAIYLIYKGIKPIKYLAKIGNEKLKRAELKFDLVYQAQENNIGDMILIDTVYRPSIGSFGKPNGIKNERYVVKNWYHCREIWHNQMYNAKLFFFQISHKML